MATVDPDRDLHFSGLKESNHWWLPETTRLALAAGDLTTAHAAARASASVAERDSSPPTRAAAEPCNGLVDRDPSRVLAAADLYRETGLSLSLARLSRTPRCCSPSAPTPTEVMIAELVACVLSNPDIAAELCQSGRTVEYHVSRVLIKLDARSRVEIARKVLNRQSASTLPPDATQPAASLPGDGAERTAPSFSRSPAQPRPRADRPGRSSGHRSAP